jgi:uncharacterized LabA/DUF88 family protein
MSRVVVYVDGFNLYHAIADLNRPHLKWVDLWGLSNSLLRTGETLAKVLYFSAYATWLPAQYARHREFVAALTATGVTPHLARFKEKQESCKRCKHTWKGHEEKETDVHVALCVLEDALDNAFDRAIIISADSDLVPVVRKVRLRLPGKEVFLAIPPGRFSRARDLIAVCSSKTEVTLGRISKHLLPHQIVDSSGKVIATRPSSYDPPATLLALPSV